MRLDAPEFIPGEEVNSGRLYFALNSWTTVRIGDSTLDGTPVDGIKLSFFACNAFVSA
jgi:hypothetical protein